jgi:ATP-dependent protease Clp ATPase subunit
MTHCSFCGKSQARVRALFESSGLPGCICNECLDICRKILEDDKKRLEKAGTYRTSSTTVAAEVLHCHFCRRLQHVVDKLISAPAGQGPCFICDRCVNEGLGKLAPEGVLKKRSWLKRLMRSFKTKPTELQHVN